MRFREEVLFDFIWLRSEGRWFQVEEIDREEVESYEVGEDVIIWN